MSDPQTLLTNAKCYLCLGVTMAEALQLAILDQIEANGGTGGANLTSGHGAPIFTPTSTVAIYIDEDTGSQYNWYSGVWH